MASSDVSLASEHVQRLLQCAVCLELFKQPKILPCQHTFCLRPCLEGLVDHRTRSIRCPECRADHFVPRSGVTGFPNNLTVIGFLELSQNSSRANDDRGRSERGGGGGDAGVVEAAPDNSSRGSASQQLHQMALRAASPPTMPVDAAGAEGGGCSVCHAEGRITRCGHCDQLVCNECRRIHIEQVKVDLSCLISQVRRGLPQITEQILTMGRKGTRLQNNCECVKVEITEAMEKHIRELKARERTLREDVDSFLMGELRTIRTYQENAEVEIASLASFCDSAESMLSMNRPIPDGDLMEMKRQSQEHVETVNCYEDGTIRPPNLKQIQASLESPFLSSTIGNFGDLIITSRTSGQREATSNVREPLPSMLDVPPSRRTRASVPPQAEHRPAVVLEVPAISARANSNSPREVRRLRQPSVYFADETPPREEDNTSRWDALSRSMRPNRRSRQERNSDTRIAALMGNDRPTLSQVMRNRARHRSLGALPATSEYSDEESPPREETQGRTIRDDAEEDSSFTDPLSSTYPGARSGQFLPPSVRFDIDLNDRGDDIDDSGNLGLFQNSNSPSIYVNSPRNRYNQKGTAVVRFGDRGSEPKSFTWPRGVAVSPMDDHIFVSDSSNHRVQVFDNSGKYLKSFGTYGQGNGEFDCLAGIAINGLGQIIIADRYNHRVQVLDRNGRFQCSFGSEGSSEGQLNYPWGVACDNMGFIYVCDKENHRIQVFQSNGAFVRTFGHYGNRSGQFENPHYIAVSPDNKVYVSDSSNHRIQVFSIYGDFLFSFGICGTLRGQMKFPRGLAIDHQGFVVVADSGNNRIQIFRGDGRFYTMFGSWGSENGHFKGLEGVAILANGNIVVSDRENHRIQIF
ncbi:RING finger protein nhl-1 [Aplysia californica]|uniref:RING finger protein nhl-1 n=1 Tax=Aplysia californica TaxID=6500 RepID=A0ABM0JIH1_APLCA|nr:RING finger protein nhl-1 [Aplysia californica]